MILMHECPHCGETLPADPWKIVRFEALHCENCGSREAPSEDVRRLALRLLRVRKDVELEQLSRDASDVTTGPDGKPDAAIRTRSNSPLIG